VINDWSMFTRILGIVAEEGNVDSVISFLAHTGTAPGVMQRLKPSLQDVRVRFPERVFILCARMPREMADEFTAMGFLIFEDPTRAIAAVAALARLAQGYGKLRVAQQEVKAAPPLQAGPINEAEAKRILSEAAVPFAPERVARTRDEAVAAAKELGFPAVLKILSADIAHKTEAGGVALGLRDADEVANAYAAMMAAVAEREPHARIDGVLVARMIAGIETVIGVKRDAVFGPVVMFGLGGVYVEVLKDVTVRLAPVDHPMAIEMIRTIRGFPLLTGARGRPPVDLDALADALVAMSRFGAAHPEVASAEINPFIALPQGGAAVDALILTGGTDEA
jgi:acyl-CoA synthetase (NDP forming)